MDEKLAENDDAQAIARKALEARGGLSIAVVGSGAVAEEVARGLMAAGHLVVRPAAGDFFSLEERASTSVVVVYPMGREGETSGGAPSMTPDQAVGSALATRAQRVILLSSFAARGPRPFDGSPAPEEGPSTKTTPEGERWAAIESAFQARERTGAFELVILRLGHVYGRGHAAFLNELIHRLRDGGSDYCRRHAHDRLFLPLHLDDAIHAVLGALSRGCGIYLVSDGTLPPLHELLSILRRVAAWKEYPLPRFRIVKRGRPSEDAVHYPYAPHRAVLELGFSPTVRFESGIARLLDELRIPPDLRAEGADIDGALAFEEGGSTTKEEVWVQEARFWDEEHRKQRLLYLRPHDWRMDVRLGNVLQAPVYRFLKRAVKRFRPALVLDLGCGGGIYSLVLAYYLGIRVVGVDLSPAKIEAANLRARELKISHLAHFEVGNALDFQLPVKADMVVAFGALHHFPDLEQHLPGILARNLVQNGPLLAVEPHCEDGYHPTLNALITRIGRSRFLHHFDVEGYLATQARTTGGGTLTTESPAGVHFHRADFDIDTYLKSHHTCLRVRYVHALAPFCANTFVIYMKLPWAKRVARFLMPVVMLADRLLCRWSPGWRRWASEGLYLVQTRSAPAPLDPQS